MILRVVNELQRPLQLIIEQTMNKYITYAAARIVKVASVLRPSILLGMLLMSSTLIAAPITFNTALPVSEEQYVALSLIHI